MCSVCDETDGETQREREKETKLLKLKAGLCSILLFLDVQKPKAKLFGSHKCISLFGVSLCGVLVFVYTYKRQKKTQKKKKREKRKEFFFLKDVQNPKRTTHQKTVTSFFSSFFSSSSSSFRRHSFHRSFF